MMQQPIVTSRLLMDLEDVANREDLMPRDPWEGSPGFIPDDVHEIVVLRIDGTIERLPDPAYSDPDWSTIAAYRYEDALGNKVDAWDYDGDFED